MQYCKFSEKETSYIISLEVSFKGNLGNYNDFVVFFNTD